MKARRGRIEQKALSPRIGRWLKRYFSKRTCKAGLFGALLCVLLAGCASTSKDKGGLQLWPLPGWEVQDATR